MKRTQYWYSLDNAGKIYPAVSNASRSGVFRLSFYISSPVNAKILEQAVNEVLPRFETFAVTLKSGLFWYYYTANKRPFYVKEESPIVCKYIPWTKNNGYLFSVYYYENKITLETFHALADGTGAMEFLKSIIYTYYKIHGIPLDHEGFIISQSPYTKAETSDMYMRSFDPNNKMKLKEEAAYHISGERFAHNFSLALRIKTPTEQILQLARSKNVTISEYITALVAYGIYLQLPERVNTNKPIKMFIPVNLRKFFDSPTLRNFSLYIKVTFSQKEAWDFDKMLIDTKKQFREQLNKENLHARINSNVGFEKNMFIRLLPLCIKTLGFKIGYYFLGENINTFAISNLGNIKLPSKMKDYVKDIDFSIGGTSMAIASVNGNTNFMFNTQYKDLSIIHTFIKHLTNLGFNLEIDTNYREGLDEVL